MTVKKKQDLTSKLEDQLFWLNRDVLFELITLRQPFLNIHWGAKLESTIRKFMFPLSCFLTPFLDHNGQLSYFDLWRILKQLNIRTFNLNTRELESSIIQVSNFDHHHLTSLACENQRENDQDRCRIATKLSRYDELRHQ